MNPFHPFTPVSGSDFIDRTAEMKIILDRLSKLGNTAIVGNPHIGKSSLLRQLANPAHFNERCAFAEIDFQLFGEKDTSDVFWREVLAQAEEGNPSLVQPFKPLLKKKSLDKQALNRAFQQIGRNKGYIIILADEFDYLFNLPAFNSLDFLGPLRVITMKSRGLVLVTASRLSVAQMNVQGEKLKATRGSDLFNYLDELSLGCFDEKTVREWLKANLPTEAINEVLLLAGRHPLMLQLAGDILFDAISLDKKPSDYPLLREEFIHRVETQFQDVWNYLSEKAQIALVIFALSDLQGEAGGHSFSLEKTDQTLLWYQAEVKDMARRGTLEVSPASKYRLGSLAFRLWLIEQKVVATRGEEPQEAFAKWLHDKQFKLGGLITNEEIAFLQKVWRAIPTSVIDIAKKAILPKALL